MSEYKPTVGDVIGGIVVVVIILWCEAIVDTLAPVLQALARGLGS